MQAIFEVSQDWKNGLVGHWVIKNIRSKPLESWNITFETTFDIKNLWGGEIVSREGNRYTVGPKPWNSRLAPGENIRVGFVGNNATSYPHRATLIDDLSASGPTTPDAVAETVSPAPGFPDMAPPAAEIDDPMATVDFVVTKQWAKSFTADLSFTYTGTEMVDGWEFTFYAPFSIVNVWSGKLVASDNGWYTVSNPAWNSELSPGETVTIGFKAKGQPTQTPREYALNGIQVKESLTGPSIVTSPDTPVAESAPQRPLTAPPQQDSPTAPVSGRDRSSAADSSSGYGEALQKSFLFYEAQRSGDLPRDNRIAWRGDSALNDGADVGVDLSGGYYDAGDHVKFGLPIAASMTMLSWGVLEYRDAYVQSRQLDEALAAIKWGTDYLLKAHISDGQKTQAFYGQVGDAGSDHAYWGPPEKLRTPRPAYKIDAANPGSDLAAETAAALASASILFRRTDASYADTLLSNAVQLYDFADTYRGRYSDSIPQARNYYNSWSGYNDELAWGAAWLYKATGERQYLNKAQQNYKTPYTGWTQSWDDKSYGTGVLLAQLTNQQQYRRGVESWLNNWVSGGINTTNGGLAWLDTWGSLRYSANTAFIAGVYSDTVNAVNGKYDDFSRRQIDYILGDNPAGQSYLVGFGDDYPDYIHHRSSSGTRNINAAAPNRYVLHGALVGGPTSANDFSYVDSRTDFLGNEVALDFNAGFTGAVARLYGQEGGALLGDNALIALSEVGVSVSA